jgi:hypothetical protein
LPTHGTFTVEDLWQALLVQTLDEGGPRMAQQLAQQVCNMVNERVPTYLLDKCIWHRVSLAITGHQQHQA